MKKSLSGHSNLVHQNLTARVTITDCQSDITGLFPFNSESVPGYTECQSPKCENEYHCENNGNCIRPPSDDPDVVFCECQAGFKGRLYVYTYIHINIYICIYLIYYIKWMY